MQKKLIAFAIAAATSSAAFAQSNVTIYGTIDMGWLHRSGSNGAVANSKSVNHLQSNSAESLIGFKGSEDLGNGLKAIFDIAYKFSPDENSGLSAAARQYVGLTGGFGTVVAGYLDGVRYGIYGKHDPFGNYSVGNFQQMTVQYARAANAIAYISPSFKGLTIIAAHATNTQGNEGSTCTAAYQAAGLSCGGNHGDDRLYTLAAAYVNGPFSADLDYETTKTVGFSSDARLYVATAAASYDFGVAKASVILDKIHGQKNSLIGANNNRNNYLLGISVPMGKTSLLASYGLVRDDLSDKDAQKYSVGARYALSKRTTLYANYAHISNDRLATHQINPMGNAGGTASGVNGIDMGIKHTF